MCKSDVSFDLIDDGESCIRFYNRDNEHVLSMLPCCVDSDGNTSCVDLADPDGHVLFCGVDVDLVNIFCKYLGIENIEDIAPIRKVLV